MNKILFIQDHLHGGGAEKITIDFAKTLAEKFGFQVLVFILNGQGSRVNIPSSLETIDLMMPDAFMKSKQWRKKHKKLPNSVLFNLIEKIEDFDPDVIIAGHDKAYWLSPVVNRNIFFWIHGEIFDIKQQQVNNIFRLYKEKRRIYFERKYLNYLFGGKKVICVNQDIKSNLQNVVKNVQAYVLPNGVDSSRILKCPNKNLEECWDVLYVGRLDPEKQVSHILHAYAASNLNGKIAVIGDGTCKSDLERLAVDLGISDRVAFLGWIVAPYEYIEKSKVVALSSKTEGSPLVIAESILLDTPVVAYNCSQGVEHQLASGELRRGLVDKNNIEALADKFKEIVNNPYSITEEDKKRLRIETMADKFLQILDTL